MKAVFFFREESNLWKSDSSGLLFSALRLASRSSDFQAFRRFASSMKS